jgi:hypothetical protein
MFRSAFRVSTIAMVGVSLTGCGWLHWGAVRKRAEAEKAVAESRRTPIAVGRVALVNAGEHFALIEANLAQPPAAGTTLRIYSGGAVSVELRATGVRRRPFLVADLVSGMPEKGDLVMQLPANESTPPRATAVTPAPSPSPAATIPRWKKWLPFFGRRK